MHSASMTCSRGSFPLLPRRTSALAKPSYRRQTTRRHASALKNLGVMQPEATRPIDRIRYQARIVFELFDKDQDGQLAAPELSTFLQFCSERLGDTPELQNLREGLLKKSAKQPEGSANFEDFVDLVRDHIRVISANKTFIVGQVENKELTRLLFKSCLSLKEMTTAFVMFRFLDADSDNMLRIDQLEKAQGIEAQFFESVLEDADEDEDGLLTFEEFLCSYHKERPIFLSMMVMAAHAASFYYILTAPFDFTIRAVLCLCILVKPMIVTAPMIKIYQMGKALVGGFMANRELAKRAMKPARS